MSARRGHLHRRPRRELAHDVREVVALVVLCRVGAVHAGGRSGAGHPQPREQRIGARRFLGRLLGHRLVGEHRDQLAQAADAQHGHAGHQGGLGRGALGHHHLLVARVGRRQHGGQDAAHRPYPAVQAQFADHHDVGEHPGIDPLGGPEHGARDGQVEPASGLRDRGRAEPHGELLLRPLPAGVDHGRPDPVPALGQALVRQPHQRERRDPRFQVGLHLHDDALDAHQRHRARTGEPHVRPPPAHARRRVRRGPEGARRPRRCGPRRAALPRVPEASVPRACAAGPPWPA